MLEGPFVPVSVIDVAGGTFLLGNRDASWVSKEHGECRMMLHKLSSFSHCSDVSE